MNQEQKLFEFNQVKMHSFEEYYSKFNTKVKFTSKSIEHNKVTAF